MTCKTAGFCAPFGLMRLARRCNADVAGDAGVLIYYMANGLALLLSLCLRAIDTERCLCEEMRGSSTARTILFFACASGDHTVMYGRAARIYPGADARSDIKQSCAVTATVHKGLSTA